MRLRLFKKTRVVLRSGRLDNTQPQTFRLRTCYLVHTHYYLAREVKSRETAISENAPPELSLNEKVRFDAQWAWRRVRGGCVGTHLDHDHDTLSTRDAQTCTH